MHIKKWLDSRYNDLITIRRHLHQYPETGFNEFETSKYLKNILSDAGYSIVSNSDMRTGFYCDYGTGSGPVICIRSDIDALAMDDDKTVDYHSHNKGVMHGCGHDVHMTVAMGISLWIIENQTEISGKIRFLFQPAEEQLPGGSLDMIKGGAIDNVDNIVGYHVLPKMDAGKFGIRYGAMAATVEIIEITLTGDGGHTSRPHQTANLVLAQAHLIMELNETLSNNIDHRTPVVLAFGSIAGGDAINVIPGKINLRGTIRYLDPGIRQTIHDLIKGAIDRVEKSSGARITYSIPGRGPGIVNDDKTAELVIRSAGETLGSDNVEILKQSSMGGEDFGNYLEKVPGAYFRLGCSNGICKDVHTVNFDVNEICIPAAIEVLNQVITNYFLEDTKPL